MVSAWLRRNAIVVALAAIAAGIATWAFTRTEPSSGSAAGVAKARARLSACLLDEPVSRTGPDVPRLRAIQLAGAPDWPKRCAPYGAAVEHALPHTGGGRTDAASTDLLGGHLFKYLSLERDIETLLHPAEDEPILALADVARDVPRPPAAPVIPREVASVTTSASALLGIGDPDLGLLIGNDLVCRFAARAGGLEPVAHCTFSADSLAYERTMPVPSTRVADLQLIAKDGIHAFASGERVIAATGAQQASNVGGRLFVWPADATRTSVLRRDPDGTTTSLRLPHRIDETATLVGTQLLWYERDRVVGVSLDGRRVGPVYEVAKRSHLPVADVCASDDVAGALLVDEPERYRVAAFSKGAWRVSEPGPRYTLSCAGGTVTGLSADTRSVGLDVDRIDCGAAGCTSTHAEIPQVRSPFSVTASGADTIVVWVDDLVRGVRGPLSQLPSAKPFLIFDGSSSSDFGDDTLARPLVQHVDVFGRGSSALVVLHSDRLLLVHVRDGKPERVAVDFD